MTSGQNKLMISSIRHPAEAEFLKKQENFYLLAVVADKRIRFERKLAAAKKDPASTRSDDRDILTWENFKKLDDFENKGQVGHGQQVEKTLSLADFAVENNGTKAELKQKIHKLLAKIGV